MISSTLLRQASLLVALSDNLLSQKPVLTEDFESGKIDPAVWDVRQKGGETIAVEPIEGAHGEYALHVHYTENERGAYAFIVATNLPAIRCEPAAYLVGCQRRGQEIRIATHRAPSRHTGGGPLPFN